MAISPTMPTLDVFKRFSRRLAPAARTVLMARVFAQMERERVDAYVQPIFESFGFTYGLIAKGLHTGLIPTPREMYLVDDGPRVAEYYEACDQAHRAHGFTGPHGHCPALCAETLVREAEHALIDLAEPLCGITSDAVCYGENRAKYLDILIGAALKAETDPTLD